MHFKFLERNIHTCAVNYTWWEAFKITRTNKLTYMPTHNYAQVIHWKIDTCVTWTTKQECIQSSFHKLGSTFCHGCFARYVAFLLCHGPFTRNTLNLNKLYWNCSRNVNWHGFSKALRYLIIEWISLFLSSQSFFLCATNNLPSFRSVKDIKVL